MKIIEQSYEILSMPNNILGLIEAAGRTCYKSEDKIGCTELSNTDICPEIIFDINYDVCCNSNCSAHSSQKFVKMIRDKGHHAMLEFGGDITVRFITNRGVTHELVRHRLFSFAQESTRYVNYKEGIEFIKPVWWNDTIQEARNNWLIAMQYAEDFYCDLLKNGWRPEQAREVLPNSTKTEIVVKGNSRQWRHALKLRTSKKSHPQIRSLMTNLLNGLKERIPIVFDDIKG